MAFLIFVLVLVLLAIAYAVWYSRQSPEKKAAISAAVKAQQKASAANKKAKEQDKKISGKVGHRQKVSDVGVRGTGGAGLACPRCGSTQFTAKRSNTGKAFGFATLGVGGLIAPKSQVKCVACGAMFKRG